MVLDTNQSLVLNISLLSYDEMSERKVALPNSGQFITELGLLV